VQTSSKRQEAVGVRRKTMARNETMRLGAHGIWKGMNWGIPCILVLLALEVENQGCEGNAYRRFGTTAAMNTKPR
jgi:hypothetical protein